MLSSFLFLSLPIYAVCCSRYIYIRTPLGWSCCCAHVFPEFLFHVVHFCFSLNNFDSLLSLFSYFLEDIEFLLIFSVLSIILAARHGFEKLKFMTMSSEACQTLQDFPLLINQFWMKLKYGIIAKKKLLPWQLKLNFCINVNLLPYQHMLNLILEYFSGPVGHKTRTLADGRINVEKGIEDFWVHQLHCWARELVCRELDIRYALARKSFNFHEMIIIVVRELSSSATEKKCGINKKPLTFQTVFWVLSLLEEKNKASVSSFLTPCHRYVVPYKHTQA